MKQADEITIKAFLIALEQLETPLPEAKQTQLLEIAEDIDNHLEKLEAIAQNNPRLNELYQEVYIYLQNNYAKGETLLRHNLSYESQRILNLNGVQLSRLFKDFINKINLEANYQLKNPLEKDPECLIGLSQDELEALANSVLSISQQEQLNSLLVKNSESRLSAQENLILDLILAQVDKLTILKTRARYTLKKLDTLMPA